MLTTIYCEPEGRVAGYEAELEVLNTGVDFAVGEVKKAVEAFSVQTGHQIEEAKIEHILTIVREELEDEVSPERAHLEEQLQQAEAELADAERDEQYSDFLSALGIKTRRVA